MKTLTLTRLPGLQSAINVLAAWLPADNCALQSLTLTHCGISYIGARQLGEGFAKCRSLTAANLSSNAFTDAGLRLFEAALGVAGPASRLTTLNVSDNMYSDSESVRNALRLLARNVTRDVPVASKGTVRCRVRFIWLSRPSVCD